MPKHPTSLKLANAPIVEAVLDIDCDLPLPQEIAGIEGKARDSFREQYPKFRKQYVQGYRIQQQADEPPEFSAQRGVQAFQFL